MALTGHGHTGRQRLRPWLIDQINSGSYPGLRWIDQEQMIFQISWKHFGKPGVNEERDAKIFREWARHTGKFKSGDPPDPSTWKTRFRCALYKLQDIEEMSSMNMLDGEEPYRVYRFKSKEEVEQESKNSATMFANMTSPATSVDEALENHRDDVLNLPSDLIDIPGNFGDDMGIDNPDNFLSELSNSSLAHQDFTGGSTGGTAVPIRQTLSSPVGLRIQLFNKGKEIGDPIMVNNPMGCRIAFRAPPPLPNDVASEDNAEVVSHIFGPFQAEQVYFPETEDADTMRLLGFMRRGLVLQTNNKDIYATRLCQAKIYFANTQMGDAQPMELRREHTTKVFDFHNTFTAQLNAALCAQSPPPRAELFFCFGQRWGSNNPLKENLVSACVTHLLADRQLKAFCTRKSEVLVSEPNALDVIAHQIEAISINNDGVIN